MNKIKVFSIIAISFISAVIPNSILAQVQGPPGPCKPILGIPCVRPNPNPPLLSIIQNIQGFLFGFLLIIAAIFILYAAYLYLTGGGNEKSVESAKKIILYAVVAIVVAFLSEGIVFIVKQLLNIS